MRRRIMASIGVGAKKMPTARDYVQDGLIHMWDGIENAGWGVHDPNATVWKDLIGDIDFERQGTFGDDHLYTNGFDQSITVPVVTLEILFSAYGHSANRGWICDGGMFGGVALGPSFSGNVGVDDIVPLSDFRLFGNDVVYSNTTYLMSCRVDGSLVRIARDGYDVNTVRIGSSIGLKTEIFNGYNSSRASYGRIYCIRAYNRSLTSAEIETNYEIDKARFGLA